MNGLVFSITFLPTYLRLTQNMWVKISKTPSLKVLGMKKKKMKMKENKNKCRQLTT